MGHNDLHMKQLRTMLTGKNTGQGLKIFSSFRIFHHTAAVQIEISECYRYLPWVS
jgi:hypothetical protein